MIQVFIPDYIIQISSSQHGWISIVIINNQCYDWGFQSRFSAMASILSMDMIYSTMKGIVPSCCRLTTRHLGATLFKVDITSNMQVPCHCQHAPWHLGANAKSFFAQLIEDPTHHILNEPALGGYQLLLSKIQGTQALIHYIERSTTQLVEYKALNRVDVGSSPMVEITSYDVIISE